MQHLKELNLLIDKASTIAGSDYKLAQQLGVPRQSVSNWRYGRKTATPADQVLIADIAGLDPIDALANATIEMYADRKKGDDIKRALTRAMSSWKKYLSTEISASL